MQQPLRLSLMRPFLGLLAALLAIVVIAGTARAERVHVASDIDLTSAPAVLIMIGDPGCPYCARWEREVAPGYTASEDGKLAPLVRRDRRAPDIAFIERVVFSPTFVMLVRGREIGRIVGYAGADLFWMQHAGLMADVRIALQRSGAAAPNLFCRAADRKELADGRDSKT
jgi:hypothetical protein